MNLHQRVFQVRKFIEKYAAIICCVLAKLAFILTFIGLLQDEEICKETKLLGGWEYFTDVLYETTQVLLLNMEAHRESNCWVASGRFFAVLFIIFLGAQAINQLLGDALTKLKLWLWCRIGNHHIVCGLGRIGWPIAKQLNGQGKRVVIIEKDPQNPRIEEARKLGMIVQIGDATQESQLLDVRVGKAAAIYAMTGNETTNTEILIDWQALRDPLVVSQSKCWIHFENELVRENTIKSLSDKQQVIPVNMLTEFANRLIIDELTPLRPSPDEVALYVVFGFGSCGQTLVRQLTELANFENCKRSRILILCNDPGKTADDFLGQYGRFAPCRVIQEWEQIDFDPECDAWSSRKSRLQPPYAEQYEHAVEYAVNAIFAPLPASMSDLRFLQMVKRIATAAGVKPAAILCHESDELNFHQSLDLQNELMRQQQYQELPIYAWLSQSEPLTRLLQEKSKTAQCPRAFGSFKDGAKELLKNQGIPGEALLIHSSYHNVTEQEKLNVQNQEMNHTTKFLTDEYVFQHSNMIAAKHFWIKIQCLGLKAISLLYHPLATSLAMDDLDLELIGEIEHNRWMAERLLQGYYYGPKIEGGLGRLTMVPRENITDKEERKKDTDQFIELWRHARERYAFVKADQGMNMKD